MAVKTDSLEFYDLSHPWSARPSLPPRFPDFKIKSVRHHAKSGILSQQTTTFMQKCVADSLGCIVNMFDIMDPTGEYCLGNGK